MMKKKLFNRILLAFTVAIVCLTPYNLYGENNRESPAAQNMTDADREKLSEALARYDSFGDFWSEGMLCVAIRDESGERKYGFIDKTGNEVIPCIYDKTYHAIADYIYFSNGFAAVRKDKFLGFIDKTGKEVIPCIYYPSSWQDFSDGLARVERNDGFYGFIDTTGKEVISLADKNYKYVVRFSEGLAEISQEINEWGYIDKTGKIVIPCIYDHASSFSEGLAGVGKKDKYGFIDKTGKIVIPLIYSAVSHFSEGLALARKGGWGYIDKTGKEIIPFIYGSAENFSGGMASVWNGEHYGFIDKTGKLVIPYLYDFAADFTDGLAAVLKDGLWGYIDKTGKVVIPFIFENTGSFNSGLARATYNQAGFIDTEGYFIGAGVVVSLTDLDNEKKK